ncbi:hypothetical protein RhiXN_10799 [Rhizoctonia solani]|uniref:Uncharacterized protein n=1 Tax=Rhizoctonia solani TaxID=456999 RepID=A0A8H8T2D5_9AGAM|nr:uncharacterized protein RhiXN_10799 [Rhizoctonia solani]QRW25722.1 hypothetical protein RhiXN_10799 [Rhizoctonia solani]
MSILLPVAPAGTPGVTLEALQVLERLGGSDGYLEHLLNNNTVSGRELAKSTNLKLWPVTLCEIQFVSPRWLGLRHAQSTVGVLLCDDWKGLTAEPVRFEAITGRNGEEGRLMIHFWRDNQLLAQYTGREVNLPRVHFEGPCTWKLGSEASKPE